MKKTFVLSLSSLAIIFSASPSPAIDLVLSKNNLRLNNTNSSTSFTVTLNDDISALSGSGFIPAKLKIRSRGISSDLTKNKILIPYTDGVIGVSDPVTLSLKDANVTKSSKVPLAIKVPKRFKKKYALNNFSKKISVDAEAIQISGKVTVPAESINSFKSRTYTKLRTMRARGIAPFNTENPEGVIVELVAIDPSTGEASGEPVASAITDADGNFDMEMPAEVDFGTGFALIVEGEEEAMHAPLFSDEVNVNPATEALFELTQEAVADPSLVGLAPGEEISFENFTDIEAEGLNMQMEELNPIYEETLDASVQSLKDSYAAFLNNMIGVAADDDTSSQASDLSVVAKGIAGDYNVVFFNSRITSEERIDLSVELAAARMSKPDEVGALTVTPAPSFSTNASLNQKHGGPDDNNQGPGPDDNNQEPNNDGANDDFDEPNSDLDNNEPDPQVSSVFADNAGSASCYEIEARSEVSKGARNADAQGNFYMTVDAAKIISFAEPAVEESFDNPDGRYVYRSQPSVMKMIPVGEGMFLSSMISIGSAISPTKDVEYEYDAGFGSIIKKSILTEGDITGTYGIVGLGYEVGSGSYGARSFVGDLVFAGSNVNFNINQSYRNVNNISCGDSYALESGDEEQAGLATLKFQGDRVSINVEDDDSSSQSLFTGFARPDAKILTLAYAKDSGAKGSRIDFDGNKRNVIEDAERQIIFGVKKPTSLVNLNAKTYRLLSLNFAFNADGGRTIERSEVGTLAFSGSTVDLVNMAKTSFIRATGASESVETTSSVVSESALAYTLTADGAVSLMIGSQELSGFVADDMSLIVFNADGDSSLGVYLAILQ